MAGDDQTHSASTAEKTSSPASNNPDPDVDSRLNRSSNSDQDKADSPAEHEPTGREEEEDYDGEKEGNTKDERNLEANEARQEEKGKAVIETEAPPLPDEDVPPLPDEAPPSQETASAEDDGWEPVWDASAQAYYFYNRITGTSQWENPRVPNATLTTATGSSQSAEVPIVHGGYNPAIHGDYDPTAPYAQQYEATQLTSGIDGDNLQSYAAAGTFNRFTGRWQDATLTPDNFNDENKSRRQMNAFFDVDAAANSHDGRSLKAERSGKKLTKAEVKAFREKRRERKEEKRRAWLRD